VAAEHERTPLPPAFEDTDDVGPARRRLLHLDVEADPAQMRRDRVGDGRLARGARHERRIDRVDRHQIAQELDHGIHD
jgi:hypothetical protein